MKNENKSTPVNEFVGLKSKMHCIINERKKELTTMLLKICHMKNIKIPLLKRNKQTKKDNKQYISTIRNI